MAYVFYDVETTGLDTRFDQITSFAAVRTDADLVETDRFECSIRLLPHIIPHPEALSLNGVSIDELIKPERPSHYEAIRAIRLKLEAWSPALFIGYNSIRFDEELLRQAFYQTLHLPYLTSMNGNSRADALTLVRTIAFLSPGALEIPRDGEGRRSCKLADIAAANGLYAGEAHTARADAERTLNICRRVADADPETWSRFLRSSTKAAVDDLLETEDAVLFIGFSGNDAVPVVVAFIGRDTYNRNSRLCVPLAPLVGTSAELGGAGLKTALAELQHPIVRIKANGCPVICALDEAPEGLITSNDPNVLLQLGAALRAETKLCEEIRAMSSAPFPKPDRPLEPEERIHEHPITDLDASLLRQFHLTPWAERLDLLKKLSDDRLWKLGRRLLYIERPDLLPDRQRYDAAIHDRVRASPTSPWRTLDAIDPWFNKHPDQETAKQAVAYRRMWP